VTVPQLARPRFSTSIPLRRTSRSRSPPTCLAREPEADPGCRPIGPFDALEATTLHAGRHLNDVWEWRPDELFGLPAGTRPPTPRPMHPGAPSPSPSNKRDAGRDGDLAPCRMTRRDADPRPEADQSGQTGQAARESGLVSATPGYAAQRHRVGKNRIRPRTRETATAGRLVSVERSCSLCDRAVSTAVVEVRADSTTPTGNDWMRRPWRGNRW